MELEENYNQSSAIYGTINDNEVDVEGAPDDVQSDPEIQEEKSSSNGNSSDKKGKGKSKKQKQPTLGPDGLPIEEVEEEEEEGEEKVLRVRRCATIMNILNSLLGAGILSVPHSFVYCGIIPSLVMLIIIAILSHIGTVMTMKLARRKEAVNLDDLAFKILGKFGSIAISICSMLFCISCMVGYLVICSNTIIS